jgi:hypothetical protein
LAYFSENLQKSLLKNIFRIFNIGDLTTA